MQRSGFTLIELSIVLVIIGLVIGGVLVGRDLIHSAEVNAQISQLRNFDMATAAFKLKYSFMPGDISKATANKVGVMSDEWSVGGDENDIINEGAGGYPTSIVTVETYLFFLQLADAGFIKDMKMRYSGNSGYACGTQGLNYNRYIGCQFPPALVGRGGTIVTSMTDGSLGWFLGATATEANAAYNNYTIGGISTGGTLTGADAYAIDSKIDDGAPTTGRIRSARYPTDMSNTYSCYSGSAYVVSGTNFICNLLIRANR